MSRIVNALINLQQEFAAVHTKMDKVYLTRVQRDAVMTSVKQGSHVILPDEQDSTINGMPVVVIDSLAEQVLLLKFRLCTVKTVTGNLVTYTCGCGNWEVSGSIDRINYIRAEALSYWSQYFKDGEYDFLLEEY